MITVSTSMSSDTELESAATVKLALGKIAQQAIGYFFVDLYRGSRVFLFFDLYRGY